jgi:hypothetical protein
MSDGYTPVFGSVFTGTLHGRWPDTGLWLCLLAMSNKHGEVDCTPQYIASATGLEVSEVTACIERFMQPDPYSRSRGEEGRRLIPLDPNRPWGWKIVNHSLYRDRARKQFHNQKAVESGANAQRMQTRRDQMRPAETGETGQDPLSDADTNTKKEQPRKGSADTRRGSRVTIPFAISEEMRAWGKSETPDIDLDKATTEFVDYWRAVPGQKGCKLDWVATWRNRMREVQARAKPRGKPEEPRRGLPVLNV